MCGITGFIGDSRLSREDARIVLQRMTDAIRHRGPDADGFWQSNDGQVNLGHRRLSIIDLSAAGSQPMSTADGRFTLIFNGEIYNFQELRAQLEGLGCRFRGSSDTEVLLLGIQEWGVRALLPRLNGMFTFAVWDKRELTLTLARDRFGEKPLYYACDRGLLIFGSELKALFPHPSFCREIDPSGLTQLLTFSYIGTPLSIFKEVKKLNAGCFLETKLGAGPRAQEAYWDPQQMLAKRGSLDPKLSTGEILDRLDQKLHASGEAKDGIGRAARSLLVGRDRLVLGCLTDAGPEFSISEDFHHRFSGRRV